MRFFLHLRMSVSFSNILIVVTLCIKDDPKRYEVHYRYGLPHIQRSPEYEADKAKVL